MILNSLDLCGSQTLNISFCCNGKVLTFIADLIHYIVLQYNIFTYRKQFGLMEMIDVKVPLPFSPYGPLKACKVPYPDRLQLGYMLEMRGEKEFSVKRLCN